MPQEWFKPEEGKPIDYTLILDIEKQIEPKAEVSPFYRSREFETEDIFYSFINIPGNSKYIKNAIVGISEADVSVLVVSGFLAEFNHGLSKQALREHLVASFALGVKSVIVCINKMEEVHWS